MVVGSFAVGLDRQRSVQQAQAQLGGSGAQPLAGGSTPPLGLCPGTPAATPDPDPRLDLASIAAPGQFSVADEGPVGALNLSETGSLAQGPNDDSSAYDESVLSSEQFLGAARRTYLDAAAGINVDARVYQFDCAAGAREHLSDEEALHLGALSPVITSLPGVAGARTFASRGPAQDGLFLQGSAVTEGNYYLVVYVTSPSPRSGSYAGTLLAAAVNRLGDWTADPASPARNPPPPGPAVLLQVTGADPPTCPEPDSGTPASDYTSLFPPTPAGFVQFPDTDGPGGLITAHQVADQAVSPPAAIVINRALGLVGGYLRGWQQNDASQLQAIVYRFTCANGASTFLNEIGRPDGEHGFTVTDAIPGAIGGIVTTRDRYGRYGERMAWTVGDVAVEIYYYTPSTSTGEIEALAPAFNESLEQSSAGVDTSYRVQTGP